MTKPTAWTRSSSGYVLLLVLILGAISAAILGSAITRTIHSATLNERNNKYTVNLSAAEAATEKAIARIMVDYQNGGEERVFSHLDLYRERAPTITEDPYWEQFEFSDGQNGETHTYAERISNANYVPLESQFLGLYGWASTYRILSNARQTSGRYTTVIGAVQQDIQLASIPVFQFAIFYNGLLEFTRARVMNINGRVHANGDIFVDPDCTVAFNMPVTASGTIQIKNWGGFTSGGSGGSISFNSVPDYRTNVAELPLSIGTKNTRTALREIINIPPSGENDGSPMYKERFYNKAGMTLVVSNRWPTNTIVILGIKGSPSDDPTYLGWTNNAPNFMTYNIIFKDQREASWMRTTQIDMNKLSDWMKDSSEVAAKRPVGILYVADLRWTTTTNKTAVRLVSGSKLPGDDTGFTVATVNPLYVLGDYNVPFNTRVPAALISDALTILSSNWDDANSDKPVEDREATNTTINAAILTGNVSSQGSDGDAPFSGGVMNLPRLLEDWTDSTLTFNTSLVNLFESARATGPFHGRGVDYFPPTRQFNFDSSFTNADKLPRGTPRLSALIRASCASPPPNTITYDSDSR